MSLAYAALLRTHPRFLAFGLLLVWFSTFGQTFFIALYSAELRAEFALSHGDFGLVYSLANLASGVALIWLGRLIDRFDLRPYTAVVCTGLVAACLVMAAAHSLVLLLIALFGLRLSCQGLMGHIAMTSMARYFETARGRALGIASLGAPLGQASFPLLAVGVAAVLDWRQAWLAFGLGLAVTLPLFLAVSLKGHGARHARYLETAIPAGGAPTPHGWTRGAVLRDRRFYLLMPGILAPAFILTGILFHQVHLAEAKGWSLGWLATSFIGFAIGQVGGSLVWGPMVDRMGAARLLPYYLPALVLGLAALAFSNHPLAALVFMLGAGISTGGSVTIAGALWAELYGVTHLGAIRALSYALMVFAAAAAPVTLGWMIDDGISVETISLLCLGYALAGSLLMRVAMAGQRAPARRAPIALDTVRTPGQDGAKRIRT